MGAGGLGLLAFSVRLYSILLRAADKLFIANEKKKIGWIH